MDILELLKSQLGGPLMERLGASVGLDASKAAQVGSAILPAQAKALADRARSPQGMQQLLGMAAQAPKLSPEQLSGDGAISSLKESGERMLPQLMGDGLDGAVESVASQTGADQGSVRGMMQLMTPLVLSHFSAPPGAGAALGAVSGLGAGAAGLGAAGLGKLGGLGKGLGGGLAGAGGGAQAEGTTGAAGLDAAGAGVAGAAGLGSPGLGQGANAASGPGGVGGVPTAPVAGGAAVADPPAGPGGPAGNGGKAGGNRNWLWWVLLVVLLLVLGGCFLLRGRVMPVAVSSPAAGATVSGPFSIKGTGGAGQLVTVMENGASVGTATVGQDGTFSADVPAASTGDHTYTLTEAGNSAPATVKVSATPPFAITDPAAGAEVPHGPFTMKGTGKPGELLEIFDGDRSLGKATVGADGTWSLNVPSLGAGAHTFAVKGPDGAALGNVQASVAACKLPFTLGVTPGQVVTAPFRFGGTGSGTSYDATVTRGGHRIGTRALPLDNDCKYGYDSGPGRGQITYVVTPSGSTDIVTRLTLTVK